MPDAPAWLREGFRDGVDAEVAKIAERVAMPSPFNPPAQHPLCFLADHDPERRPCSGPLERFHFIGRQRVRNALGALLPSAFDPALFGVIDYDPADLLRLAEWDARAGGIGCEGHHRRFDNHAVSTIAPQIVVPAEALPLHFIEYAFDWCLDWELEKKFPGAVDLTPV